MQTQEVQGHTSVALARAGTTDTFQVNLLALRPTQYNRSSSLARHNLAQLQFTYIPTDFYRRVRNDGLQFLCLVTDLGYTSSWNSCQKQSRRWNGTMWTMRNWSRTLSRCRQPGRTDWIRPALEFVRIYRRSNRRAVRRPWPRRRTPTERSMAAPHCRTPIPAENAFGMRIERQLVGNKLFGYLCGDGRIRDFFGIEFPAIVAWNRFPARVGDFHSVGQHLREIDGIHGTLAGRSMLNRNAKREAEIKQWEHIRSITR